MIEIKKCPFCGGEATVNMLVEGRIERKRGKEVMESFPYQYYYIKCTNSWCGAIVKSLYSAQDAIKSWNRRVTDEVQKETSSD